MWYKVEPFGIENFTKVFMNTLASEYGGKWRPFADALREQVGASAPTDTTLRELATIEGAARAKSSTIRPLDGALRIPLTRQYFSAKELAWMVAGEFPVRFHESDPRGAFATALLQEMSVRGHSFEQAAGLLKMPVDRLERIIALNGKPLDGHEYFDIVNYYSSDSTEQRYLTSLLGVQIDKPSPEKEENGKKNGKAHASS
jgi:hypothetical protein